MNGITGVLNKLKIKLSRYIVKYTIQCMATITLAVFTADGSAADEVHLLLSSDAPYYQQVAEVFSKELSARQPATRIRKFVMGDSVQLPAELDGQIVAIGSDATAAALASHPRSDILSLLIPMAAWHDFNNNRFNDNTFNEGNFGAVVIDQPFERAVLLGCLLKKDAQKFGAVFGPATQHNKDASVARVSDLNIELLVASLPATDNPISVLNPIVSASEIFVAVPDRAPFNRNIAKWILHLSYRQKIPVIGFSSSYTKAGALASIYSSPTDIGRHGAELFAELSASEPIADTDNIWRAYYPKYYTLSTNAETAQMLDIHLPPLDELYRMYQAALQLM